jgi:hypothetical protein
MVNVGKDEWRDAVSRLGGGKECVDRAQALWKHAGEACTPSVSQRFALRLVRAKNALWAFLLLLLPLRLMLVLLRQIEPAECEPLLFGERCGFLCGGLTRVLIP